MAGLGFSGRLLLFVVVACVVACVCEARGGRSRSRFRGGGTEGAGSSADLIIAVVIGSVTFVALVVIFILICCCGCCDSAESKNASRSNQTVTSNPMPLSTTADNAYGFSSAAYSTSYDNDDYKTSCNDDSIRNKPPSYDSANQNGSDLPYSSHRYPSDGFPNSSRSVPAGSYLSGTSSDLPYSVYPTETSYSVTGASATRRRSAESVNANSSRGVETRDSTPLSTNVYTTNGFSSANDSASYRNTYETSYNDGTTRSRVQPPSYDSAVNQNESDLPYSSHRYPSDGFTNGSRSHPAANYSSGASSDQPSSAYPTEASYSFNSASAPRRRSAGDRTSDGHTETYI